jgi:hypothetical protein
LYSLHAFFNREPEALFGNGPFAIKATLYRGIAGLVDGI